MAIRTVYTVGSSEWSMSTRKEALKEAKSLWKMYVTEYGMVNPLVGVYANHKKIGFVSRGLDGKFYFFWHGMDTYPIKSDGTLGPKVKDRVKFI